MLNCRICDNGTSNQLHIAQEMMLGLGDKFEYLECAQCGCVQLQDIPQDLAKYYPEDYYSFQPKDLFRKYKKQSGWMQKVFFRALKKTPYQKLLQAILPRKATTFIDWFKGCNVKATDSVLDVGSGAGKHLLRMSELGFTNLTGVDPNIKDDIEYPCGVKIIKSTLTELSGEYDLIMMHHSYEHMHQPKEIMAAVERLLKPGKFALVRVPLADSYAWRHYGCNWVQLDAPRHLFLHTVSSIKLLAQQAGLELRDTIYDSSRFQFWASEQYQKGNTLVDEHNNRRSAFSKQQRRQWSQQAQQLNNDQDGDQACFYLYKPEAVT